MTEFAMDNLKSQILEVCQRLDRRQFVANHDGNVSVKIDAQRFLVTPTSFAKVDVTEGDLLIVDASGKVLEGKHRVFSEISWHLAIYRARPDIQSIVHAHPPTASGFGMARREIGVPGLPEAIVSLGRHILNLKFYSPLDPAISQPGSVFEQDLKSVLKESDGFIAEGNGAWAVGNDPMHAYLRLELIEHIAKQHLTAMTMGRAFSVDDLTQEQLLSKRPKSNLSAPSPSAAVKSTPVNRETIKEAVRKELESFLRS